MVVSVGVGLDDKVTEIVKTLSFNVTNGERTLCCDGTPEGLGAPQSREDKPFGNPQQTDAH